MEEIWKLYNENLSKYPCLRKGQALYNAASTLYPDICSSIVGLNMDPFYNDLNIDNFIKYLGDNGIV